MAAGRGILSLRFNQDQGKYLLTNIYLSLTIHKIFSFLNIPK